eukprot:3765789-Amphidinium_carterae.1
MGLAALPIGLSGNTPRNQLGLWARSVNSRCFGNMFCRREATALPRPTPWASSGGQGTRQC